VQHCNARLLASPTDHPARSHLKYAITIESAVKSQRSRHHFANVFMFGESTWGMLLSRFNFGRSNDDKLLSKAQVKSRKGKPARRGA
jgi:hypothetical protein